MTGRTIDQRFALKEKVAVLIGGAGHLCSVLAKAMPEAKMWVVILDVAKETPADLSGKAIYFQCDATKKGDLVEELVGAALWLASER